MPLAIMKSFICRPGNEFFRTGRIIRVYDTDQNSALCDVIQQIEQDKSVAIESALDEIFFRTRIVGIAVHQLDIQTGLSEPPLRRGNSYPVSARPIKRSDPDGWEWGGGISRGWPAVAQDCHRRRAEEQVPGRDRAQSPPNTDQVAEPKP
jgi:hypothetical protein